MIEQNISPALVAKQKSKHIKIGNNIIGLCGMMLKHRVMGLICRENDRVNGHSLRRRLIKSNVFQ